MKVKSLVDHVNDYSLNGGPGVAVGADRVKVKGSEYIIPDDEEAKLLIGAGIVEKVSEKK
jgi:hypothetical protein